MFLTKLTSVRPHLTFAACISHCTGQFFDEFVRVLWFHSLLSTQLLDQSHTFLKRGEHTVQTYCVLHTICFHPESMMSSSIQDSLGLRSLCCVVIGWDSLWGHFYSSNWPVWQKQSGISLTNRHHSQQNDSMSCQRDSSWHCDFLWLHSTSYITAITSHYRATVQ